jgi:hypothetical protein
LSCERSAHRTVVFSSAPFDIHSYFFTRTVYVRNDVGMRDTLLTFSADTT